MTTISEDLSCFRRRKIFQNSCSLFNIVQHFTRFYSAFFSYFHNNLHLHANQRAIFSYRIKGALAQFEITRTIFLNSERSEQFLVTKCFFNLFLKHMCLVDPLNPYVLEQSWELTFLIGLTLLNTKLAKKILSPTSCKDMAILLWRNFRAFMRYLLLCFLPIFYCLSFKFSAL